MASLLTLLTAVGLGQGSDELRSLGLSESVLNQPVSLVVDDSRQVIAGSVFCALAGEHGHGLDFLPTVEAAGAAAVLWEPAPDVTVADQQPNTTLPAIPVADLAQKLGLLAAAFYGKPSESLRLLGITGTNGKTTCTHLYAQARGASCGQIGTLGYGFAGELVRPTHTTPGALRVQALLAEFATRQADEVVMEVSSHGLVQARVGGCHFDTAIFTNLSRDHLDYHGSMAEYAAAKAKLFNWPGLRCAVINSDDEFGRKLLSELPANVRSIAYGTETTFLGDEQLIASSITPKNEGLAIRVEGSFGDADFCSPLIGAFNGSNLLAVLAGLLAADMPLTEAVERVAAATAAPGRMDRLVVADAEDSAAAVVVDYAHTPDALEKALQAARAHTVKKLWCVFGCGGDRDAGKRPEMGAIAERFADQVVVTSDNPRTENPLAITDGICAGMLRDPAHRDLDRAKAIAWAIRHAAAGDLVLIAGKGHEDYQEVDGVRSAFSDHAVAREVLGRLAA